MKTGNIIVIIPLPKSLSIDDGLQFNVWLLSLSLSVLPK